MSVAIVIPARFASIRYPGKPLVELIGADGRAKPLIRRSWEAAMAVPGIDRVLVATDDERIADVARAFGAEVAMTPAECANGTERCAAVLDRLGPGVRIVVNLQGDAPLTPPTVVTALVAAMIGDPTVAVATPVLTADPETCRRLREDARAGRVGGTTAVAATNGDALYFSKAVLPHVSRDDDATILLHLGVYAYTPAALRDYAARGACRLERDEGLEQLRFLDAGLPVRLVPVAVEGALWELNNPSDVAQIEAALAARGIA